MTAINSKKIMEEFCKRHKITPNEQVKTLIQLAIMEGAVSQSKLDIVNIKNKFANKEY